MDNLLAKRRRAAHDTPVGQAGMSVPVKSLLG